MKKIPNLPSNLRKLVVNKLTNNFKDATQIVTAPMPTEIKPMEVIVRNMYAGINASDINYTAGRYRPGVQPPFDCGFEAMGEVVATGEKVKNVSLGDAVTTQFMGTFSEYQVVPSRNIRKVPSLDVNYLPIELSGCTASVLIGEVAKPEKGQTAFVSAAAGGTGQFAVQLLKLAGCTVIGACGDDNKVQYLKSLGVDRPINYKKEDISNVLSTEFPTGLNFVYESVGGKVFDAALTHLAHHGKFFTIGSISGYKDESTFKGKTSELNIPMILLSKSASLHGFFLPHYVRHISTHFKKLIDLYNEGKLKSGVDKTVNFQGLEQVADAIEHLHSGNNIGKVVVKIN